MRRSANDGYTWSALLGGSWVYMDLHRLTRIGCVLRVFYDQIGERFLTRLYWHVKLEGRKLIGPVVTIGKLNAKRLCAAGIFVSFNKRL